MPAAADRGTHLDAAPLVLMVARGPTKTGGTRRWTPADCGGGDGVLGVYSPETMLVGEASVACTP